MVGKSKGTLPSRILIVGEASGVAPTLKFAFERMGVACTVLSFSNPQRREGIRSFNQSKNTLLQLINQIRLVVAICKEGKKSDLILSLGYPWLSNIFNLFPRLGKCFVRFVKGRRNTRLIYYALGCDPFFAASQSRYCMGCLENPDRITAKCRKLYMGKYHAALQTIIAYYDLFCVSMPDYACRDVPTEMVREVPLPFELTGTGQYIEEREDRIRIVHAPSGRNRKGSRYIIEAMERIANEFGEEVECVILEGLPYEEFKKRMLSAHIIVDQCLSQSYGMLAIEGMAMGKVVLSGAKFFEWAPKPPVIDICPDIDQISDALKKAIFIVRDTSLRKDWTERSRSYVKQIHDANVVAWKFIDDR